jgi:hypothetical protein
LHRPTTLLAPLNQAIPTTPPLAFPTDIPPATPGNNQPPMPYHTRHNKTNHQPNLPFRIATSLPIVTITINRIRHIIHLAMPTTTNSVAHCA